MKWPVELWCGEHSHTL